MKNILVADNRPELLATLEPILKHWGYRVLSTSKADQVMPFIKESSPSLLIMGEAFFAAKDLSLDKKTTESIKSGELPTIALKQEGAEKSEITPGSIIVVPFELFDLFAFIQRQVENHPRQNLRLRLKLPGMYSIGDDEFLLADVLSLSMQGLFFKASSRLSKGDRITVVFPLFGQCKEIEVQASVLYTIQPEAENNFFQGFGVGFDDIPEELAEQLQIYIREYFLREVSASNDGVGNFTAGQLQN